MVARVWPLMQCLADFTLGPPNVPSSVSVDLMASTAQTVLKAWATARGRQYEMATVQTGTLNLDLIDPLEKLNPVNTSSPWNSGSNSLLPYRCVQLGAWLNTTTSPPSLTGNFLNAGNTINASTIRFDPSFESGTSGVFAVGSATYATSTAQHFVGAQSLACTFTASGDAVSLGIRVPQAQRYTLSVYVFVPASHTATVTWANYPSGSVIGSATSSTTGAWQRLTVTGVPAAAVTTMQFSCSAAYPATVYVDAFQLELGSSASAFTLTGPTFSAIYTGYIERYPQGWDMAGFRGRKPLVAVDALSPLSRTVISQSYAATVLADGPAVFVPYNDDGFPQTVQRLSGGQPYVGYQAIGSQSASVSFGGDSFLDGSKAVTLSQQNSDPITFSDSTQVTRLGTRYGSLVMNPQAFTFEAWVRWTAGQTWYGAGSLGLGESTTDPTIHDGPIATFGIRTSSNKMGYYYKDSTGTIQANVTTSVTNGPYFADSSWHHFLLVGAGSNAWRGYRDGVLTSGTYTSTPPTMKIDNIYEYVNTFYGDLISTASFANAALYGFALSAAQVAAHYQRGIGYLGEKSGARALRLLTQYWSSNVVTDTGVTSMAADFGYNGRAMLDVLQEIADTEFGLVWADTAGMIHQDSRETRYTATTSKTAQFVFGENTAGGELPYDTLDYGYDPTYVFSQANFTSAGSGTQLAPVINATTQAASGQRVLSKTLQTANDWDAGQAAQFVVQRYAKPAGAPGTGTAPRITGMTINPGANPNLWAAALSLDIGWRVTVKRRTSAGVTISGDYYVEQVNHNVVDNSTWTVTYQLSPVFVSQPWVLGDATYGVLGSTTVCVY